MQTIKAVLVGDERCGKKSLILSCTTEHCCAEYESSVFNNNAVTVELGGKHYTLDLYDVPAPDYYGNIRPHVYQDTGVFLVCFSVVSPASLKNVKEKWVPEITRHCPKTPFLLVGTMIDLRDDAKTLESLSDQTPVTVVAAEQLALEIKAVKYVECSALTQKGLKCVFNEAILAALEPPGPELHDQSKPVEKRRWLSMPLPKVPLPSLFRSLSGNEGRNLSPKLPIRNLFRSLSGNEARAHQPEKEVQQPKEEEKVHTIKVKQIKLLNMIGQGGFGSVFRGKWKARKGEVVAVKKCTMAGTKENPDVPREVQILSSVPEHPNIISFYAIAFNYPDMFIVTEFAENGSLFNYLHKEKHIPTVDQSLAWALQVAQGMEHLHNHDIIHRDLKSANVLLPSAMAVKVCNFGTARYLSHTTVQTGAAGTPRWMAPEVMEAVEANINKKCDSFSYGMVLYELLVHQVPYYDTPGDSIVCMKVMQGERPQIPPTIPQYLHSLLTTCWETDPHKRPTFQDIEQKLESQSL